MNKITTQSITLSVSDRAVQYGDGCFTTIAVVNAKAQLCEAHIKRLQHACERLYLPFALWQQLASEIASTANQLDNGVIKVLISRGSGGRGYDPIPATSPHYIISTHVLPPHYSQWQQQGIELELSNISLGKQPLLAGIKHLNRLEQVLIKRQQVLNQWQDVLVTDTDGMMVETSAANLFWQNNGSWYTPDLHYCGVEGVMRNKVIEVMKNNGINVLEVRMPVSQLTSASAVFITNSLMNIVPVIQFQQTSFAIDAVKLVQHWLSE
ncbi:aminodeoxychorismate lyase [Alteromonadaceae bacterium BrNp21-10]|nr:aminodeoxychorismate lyase [Alteromonadaceae bacterium BrNp21-10]